MQALYERLGYTFQDAALLKTALTHPSYGGDHHVPHYQRLEFLGDAVLEMCVSEALYRAHPDKPEGALTRMRADLVCEDALADAARKLGLNAPIRLSVGEEKCGGRDKPSILCDVMEAVIGAVYLDGGRDCANGLILRAIGDKLRAEDGGDDHMDAKSRLQTLLQSRGDMPAYELISQSGPPHKPVFCYRVCVSGETLGEGEGNSKQSAQIEAALTALRALKS